MRNGNGTLYGKDGTKLYEGQWLNDKQNGYGTYYYSDGSVYTGNWKNGIRNGNGTLIDKNQNKISEGMWIDDKFVSRHLNQLVDNKKGRDQFFDKNDNHPFNFSETNNQTNTQSIFYPNGDKYVGPLENGTRSGYGYYFYTNGQIYSGWFKNGEFNGLGILYYKDNKIKYEGEWKDGK